MSDRPPSPARRAALTDAEITAMTDLLSRLQAAAEGSAELDRDVLLACGWTDTGAARLGLRWIDPNGIYGFGANPTRSLDDITRMIEAKGWWPAIYPKHDQRAVIKWQALVYTDRILHNHWGDFHADIRLALCLAFLRARATP